MSDPAEDGDALAILQDLQRQLNVLTARERDRKERRARRRAGVYDPPAPPGPPPSDLDVARAKRLLRMLRNR